MSILNAPHFHDEQAAYDFVENRLWPKGPVCPRCKGTERINKMGGKSTRIGTYKCYTCRKPFTMKIDTIFESSHVGLHIWLQAIFLIASSKKGISAQQLHRTLGVSIKTAWFMTHRIREAMKDGEAFPMGGPDKVVEVDETFINHDRTKKPSGTKKSRGYAHKHKVLTLVEHGGRAHGMVVDSLKAKDIVSILKENIDKKTSVMTDDAGQYKFLNRDFNQQYVSHAQGEYGRVEVHTDTIEGYFGIFKRGMNSVYQHCAKKHLHRYLAEFDFRYTNRMAYGVDDTVRASYCSVA